MSVILDALRKAQEERKLANSRPTDGDETSPRTAMRPLYYVVGTALVLLIVLFFIPSVQQIVKSVIGVNRTPQLAQQPSRTTPPVAAVTGSAGVDAQKTAETSKPKALEEKADIAKGVSPQNRSSKVAWAPITQAPPLPVPGKGEQLSQRLTSSHEPKLSSVGLHPEQSIIVKRADVKDGATDMYNNALKEMELGRSEDARRSYLAVLADRPDDAEALNNLGVLAMNGGNTRDALTYLKMAVGCRADYPKAHNNLGMLYMKEGQNRLAEDHLRKALKLNPEGVEPYLNLGALLRSEGRFQEAAQLLSVLLQKGRKEPIIHLSYAIVNDEMGNYPEAITNYRRYLALAVQGAEKAVVTQRLKTLEGNPSSGNR
jgi:Tfp pilus assembly protein PilF